MGRESLESLDLSKIVNLFNKPSNVSSEITYLFNVEKISLHALDGDLLVVLYGLSLQHL